MTTIYITSGGSKNYSTISTIAQSLSFATTSFNSENSSLSTDTSIAPKTVTIGMNLYITTSIEIT